MKVTDTTRNALAYRRQRKRLLAAGYEPARDPLLEIICGGRRREKIIAVEISADGKGIYVKTDKGSQQ